MDEEQGLALWAQTLAAIANNAKSGAAGTDYEADLQVILNTWISYQEELHGIDIDFTW